MSDAKTELERVRAAFRGSACAVITEAELGELCSRLLAAAALPYRSEVCLGSPRDRIDFVVGRVGVELKIDGSPAAVLRQLDRYAASDEIDSLLLVTTRRSLARGLPSDLRGKPVSSVAMGAM